MHPPVFLYLLEEMGGATGGVSSAAIGRTPQKAGPTQPPLLIHTSPNSFLKAVRDALCFYCDQTARGEELQEHKAAETLET